MNSYEVKVYPPSVGVFVDLSLVPDSTFAKKIVGDGCAIDPFENKLYSPIDGIVKSIAKTKHAITISSEHGFDILVHLGLETVNLNGQGFNVKVKNGDKIKRGSLLIEFDMDYVATNASSLITPIICVDLDPKYSKLEIIAQEITNLNQPIMSILINPLIATKKNYLTNNFKSIIESKIIEISNEYGIHARPAALLASIADKFSSDIKILKKDKEADSKSIVSLLTLSIIKHDKIKIVANGVDAEAAIATLENAIKNLYDDKVFTMAPTPKANTLGIGKYSGVIAANGLAIAKLVFLDAVQFAIKEYAEDINAELIKLEQTIDNVIKELEIEIEKYTEANVVYKNILHSHIMLLSDSEIITTAKNTIAQSKTAGFAWNKCILTICASFDDTNNPILIGRKNDLIDINNRILTKLCDEINLIHKFDLNEEIILVANEFTPSQIINLPHNVKGLISINGGVTSHVAILARTKGIPLLIEVSKEIFNEKSQLVILDAQNGIINCQPSKTDLMVTNGHLIQQEKEFKLIQETANKECVTKDSVVINCLANIGSIEDAKIAKTNGADGIGLFRTEFMFLESEPASSEAQQIEVYSAINQIFNDKTFIIRTLDAGGDKNIPYLNQLSENNPMLGVRGIRLLLANKELLKTQLLAILKLNSNHIKILIPMVSKIEEYREVKELVNNLMQEINYKNDIKLGIMVEVPSVVFMSEIFAAEVDFMSIGTNDLTQYIMAADREHTKLNNEIDYLHPAVLGAIAITIKSAEKFQIDLSVCGLMASEKLAIIILLGLGIKNLSMTANNIAQNKDFIRTLDVNECKQIAKHCLTLSTAQEVKDFLNNSSYAENL